MANGSVVEGQPGTPLGLARLLLWLILPKGPVLETSVSAT